MFFHLSVKPCVDDSILSHYVHSKAFVKNGGQVESLQKLKELTNYGKPLLSYHVQGAEDSQGLAELGLVEVTKGGRGKSIMKATTLGRLLTLGK